MGEPTIGTRIIHLRQSLVLSQDTFGSKIGVTKSTVSLIERGLRTPSDRTVRDICREFSTSEEWLRNGTGDMFVQLSKEDNNLSDTDRNLINKYNQLPFSDRKIVDEILDALLIKSQIESKQSFN